MPLLPEYAIRVLVKAPALKVSSKRLINGTHTSYEATAIHSYSILFPESIFAVCSTSSVVLQVSEMLVVNASFVQIPPLTWDKCRTDVCTATVPDSRYKSIK